MSSRWVGMWCQLWMSFTECHCKLNLRIRKDAHCELRVFLIVELVGNRDGTDTTHRRT